MTRKMCAYILVFAIAVFGVGYITGASRQSSAADERLAEAQRIYNERSEARDSAINVIDESVQSVLQVLPKDTVTLAELREAMFVIRQAYEKQDAVIRRYKSRNGGKE